MLEYNLTKKTLVISQGEPQEDIPEINLEKTEIEILQEQIDALSMILLEREGIL